MTDAKQSNLGTEHITSPHVPFEAQGTLGAQNIDRSPVGKGGHIEHVKVKYRSDVDLSQDNIEKYLKGNNGQTKRTESPGVKQKSRLAGSSQGEKLKKAGKKVTHRENDNQLRLTGRTIIEGSQE